MLTYVSNQDLSFRKAGEKITYTRGNKIDPKHEHYILSHYPGRVKSSTGSVTVGSGGYTPEHVMEPAVTAPRTEKLDGITQEIVRQGEKLDKIMGSIENLQIPIPAPVVSSNVWNEEPQVLSIPRPEIKEIVLDSVVKTEGIEARGESGDNLSEGEDIDAKVDKLRSLKSDKKKKKGKEED
jgi:hypothetical protein